MSGRSFFVITAMPSLPSAGVDPAHEPASPCLRQCQVVSLALAPSEAPTSLCASCGRTLDEIAQWQHMDSEAKHACIQAAATRRQQHPLQAMKA